MAELFDKVPPHNIEAEKAVLGSILLDPETIFVVSEIISGEEFYKESHKKIFDVLCELNENRIGIDSVTLMETLRNKNILSEVGDVEYIMQLFNAVPTAANATYYANIVHEKFLKRGLIKLSAHIAQEGYCEDKDTCTLLDEAENAISNLSTNRSNDGLISIKDVVADVYEAIGVIEEGIPTFIELDKLLGGLKRTDLIIIAARPAMGKTSFCLNIGERAATKYGKSVAFFSLEMSNSQLAARMLFAHARVNQRASMGGNISGEDWSKLSESLNTLSKAPIYLDDGSGITVSEMRGKARRLKREHGLDLIIIDYIQLMQGSGGSRTENRQQQISDISRQLKAMAKELDVPVIAISQLSRAAAKNEGKIKLPELSHLRESGALEQDADIVMFIHRPEYYDPESEEKGVAVIRVAKQRSGPTGDKTIAFIDEYTLFMDLDLSHKLPDGPVDQEL